MSGWKICAVFALSLAVIAPAAVDSAAIDEFVDDQIPAAGAPGLAYAVVDDGSVAEVGSRGVVRQGSDAEVTPDTPFVIGSISKSVTALAIMQLVEAGQIDLDTGVASYLDGFAGSPAGGITIRQLLSHTSGYSTLQGNESRSDDGAGEDALARAVEGIASVVPAYAPDARWEYSNTNYQVLGRVIEVVSGQDYQGYVAEHILEPVGMTHSFVADGEVHDEMATGHRPWFAGRLPLDDNSTDRVTAPQGGVISSAGDMALYLQMMMNGEDDVVSAESKAMMMRPASAASPFYGFGWFIDEEAGTVWHAGSTPGVETLATMSPTDQSAAVVLVNAGSGMGFGETVALRNGITTLALGGEVADEGGRWDLKALFIGLVLLPIVYVTSMVWAWMRRDRLRTKTHGFGLFSLWFPLLTTLVAAWVVLDLVPRLIGAPLGTIALFQPDLGLTLVAGAVLGVAWAVFRLVVAYTGRKPEDATSKTEPDEPHVPSGARGSAPAAPETSA